MYTHTHTHRYIRTYELIVCTRIVGVQDLHKLMFRFVICTLFHLIQSNRPTPSNSAGCRGQWSRTPRPTCAAHVRERLACGLRWLWDWTPTVPQAAPATGLVLAPDAAVPQAVPAPGAVLAPGAALVPGAHPPVKAPLRRRPQQRRSRSRKSAGPLATRPPILHPRLYAPAGPRPPAPGPRPPAWARPPS